MHFAKSDSMKKVGVQGKRPKFDLRKLKPMPLPNQPKLPKKVEVPNPTTPAAPVYDPRPRFLEWIKSLGTDRWHYHAGKYIKGHINDYFANNVDKLGLDNVDFLFH